MEEKNSVRKNMFMSIVLTASNFIFPLITYTYVARTLLPDGTGKVAFVQSVLTYFMYLAALGIPSYGLRECAKVRKNKDNLSKTVQELVILNMLSTVISYILLIITILSVNKFMEYKSLFCIMSMSILLQTLGMEWLYQALEKYTYITIRSLLLKCISVVLTLVLVKKPDDVCAYGFLVVFTTSASNLLNFFNARKHVFLKKYKNYELKRHIKPIMILFMSTVVITVYTNFDNIMLGFMYNDETVGLYGAALKIRGIAVSLSTAVTAVLIPGIIEAYYQGKMERYNKILLKSLRVSLLLVLPVVSYVILNVNDIILFICGKDFLPAQNTVYIMMLCALCLCLTNLFGNQILISRGAENQYSISVFIGLFINIIFNLLLIPSYGMEGAAFSNLLSEGVNVFWMGKNSKQEIKYMLENLRLLKYAIAILVGICSELFIIKLTRGWFLFARLSVTGVIMLGSYYILLFVLKEDLIMEIFDSVKKRFL